MARPVTAWGSLPFAEQIAFFNGKVDMPTQSWLDLLGAGHDRAFVVAGAMKADLLADLHAAVLKAIEQGTTLDTFRKDFNSIVAKRGWTGWTGEDTPEGRAWRQEIIYGTNLRTSYQAGRYAQAQAIAHRRPYWRYVHNDTVKDPRELHKNHPPAGWNGLILRADNEFWARHWPPNGWNCFVPGTQVATPQGWRAIESLARGDLVIGGSGNIQTVESTQISAFEGDIVRITSKQGNASATPNHRFLTLRGWIRADNLNIGDVLVQISEVSGLDNAISDIKHTNTASGQFCVSSPCSGSQPGRMEALNADLQFRDENVNPIRKSAVVVNSVKAPLLHYIKHHLLNCGGFCAGIYVSGRIGFVHGITGICHFLSNFWPASRRVGFKFSRATRNAGIIVLGFSQAIMSASRRLMESCFPQYVRCLLTPGIISNPLQRDTFMGIAWNNAVPLHQAHNGSSIAGPSRTQIPDRHLLVDVEGAEGFASGAPLDRFDSLDHFIAWARAHSSCSTITDIQHVQYNGNVYNLSITEDSSYCLRLGVVHNCRCRVETLAQRDLDRMGKSGPDPTPDDGTYEWLDKRTGKTHTLPQGVDPGWDYTPGATRDLIAEVKAKAAGLPGKLGEALAQDVAQLAPNGPDWHARSPSDLDAVLERGRLREAELFGTSSKNMDALADKLKRLAADEEMKFNATFADDSDWRSFEALDSAVAATKKARQAGENVMEKTLKGMRAKIAEAEALLRESGVDIPKATAKAAKIEIKDYGYSLAKEVRSQAADFYKQFGVNAGNVAGIFDDPLRKRAYCQNWGHANGDLINLGDSVADKRTLWHEMGHSVEFTDGTGDVARAWLTRRATGAPIKLNDLLNTDVYRDNEIAFPDYFFDAYVGKDYGSSTTEVLSMGLENFISAKSLLDFWLKDREHFRLILGILRL